MSKRMSWFRAYTEMIDDEKLRLLAFEDRWHFVALLCLKGQGVLDESDKLLCRKVAVKLGVDLRTLEEIARRLAEVGLIDEKTLQPIAWESRQFQSDSSAERTRAYRERMKRHCDVTVTPQDTDTDTEQIKLHCAPAPAASQADSIAEPEATAAMPCPIQKIVDAYHRQMPNNPRVKVLDDSRKRTISARWREAAKQKVGPFGYQTTAEGVSAWEEFFSVCNESDFLTGRTAPGYGRDKPFIADLDFLMSPKGFKGCLENKYHREAA